MGNSDSRPEVRSKVKSGCNNSEVFVKLSEEIRSSIQKIEQNVKSLKQVLNQLETSHDLEKLKNELQPIEDKTSELIKNTRDQLKSLQIFKNPDEHRAKQTLLNDFTNILKDYLKLQNEIKEKIKTYVEDRQLTREHQEKMNKIETKMAELESFDISNMDEDGGNLKGINSLLELHQKLLTSTANYEQLSIDEKITINRLEDDVIEASEIFREAYLISREQ